MHNSNRRQTLRTLAGAPVASRCGAWASLTLTPDSPVSVALLVRSSNSSMRRASAETASPSSSTIRSPGTSSTAGI